MKILITGLCMQGNKGGPALALSLLNQIRKYTTDSTFVFSVPGGMVYKDEEHWAKIYGVSVVDNLPLNASYRKLFYSVYTWRCLFAWLRQARSANIILDMSAISYIGPPIGKWPQLFRGRFRIYLLAKVLGRPLIAWTQSYGPFSSSVVRYLACKDLSKQKIIFCRGKSCEENVRTLLPNKTAISFPDVAIKLPYDNKWGQDYIRKLFKIEDTNIVSISPSAEMYVRKKGSGQQNKHVQEMILLCEYLTKKKFSIMLIPHTYRRGNHEPTTCDFKVCKLIRKGFEGKVQLVSEDLSPMDLKSIISNAYIHVGARYHSLVASLSTSVPSVAMSWHPKYKDLLFEYEQELFLFDAINNANLNELFGHIEGLRNNYHAIKQTLRNRQKDIEERVDENTKLAVKWMAESI